MIRNLLDVFDCYLRVFITLKLFLKISDNFFNFAVLFCLIVTEPFIEWSHIFSSVVQVILFSFSFI